MRLTSIRSKLGNRPDGYKLTLGRVLAIYTGLMLAIALSTLDQTIVATASPQIVAQLGDIAHYRVGRGV
jgi:hypothetical protein